MTLRRLTDKNERQQALVALAEIADAMELPLGESVSVEQVKGHILRRLAAPSTTNAPVAYVPIHPRTGPLWANTVPNLEADRPAHYEVMPLYSAPSASAASSELAQQPVAWAWRSKQDGSLTDEMVPVRWWSFESKMAELRSHPWVQNGKAEIVPLYLAAPSATRRTHDVLLAITHGYSEWEATGDPEKLVKAINEAEIHRQEIAPPQIVTVADVVPVSDGTCHD